MTERGGNVGKERKWNQKKSPATISNDLSHMQLLLSRQQLKSLLLSSPAADKTSVEGRGFLKEISSVFLSLPDIRSEPRRPPPETNSAMFIRRRKRLSAISEGAKQRSVIVKEDGE